MANFRAVIQGQRGQASRLGSKSSGITASVNGWHLGVEVIAYHDKETGRDIFRVYKTEGSGYNRGRKELIAEIDRYEAEQVEHLKVPGEVVRQIIKDIKDR